MANILGEKVLELAEEFQKNKEEYKTFLDYYAAYIDKYFHIEKLQSEEIIAFMDRKLESIRGISREEQNENIRKISSELKEWFIVKELLKTESSFDALEFLALTMIGRIKKEG